MEERIERKKQSEKFRGTGSGAGSGRRGGARRRLRGGVRCDNVARAL